MTGAQTAWGGTGDSPQVSLGQTPDEVIAILGQPDQIVDLGSSVIYAYGSRRITFTGERVAGSRGERPAGGALRSTPIGE